MPNHKTCRLGYASAKIRLIFSCRAFLLAGLACFCLAMPISRAAKDSKELIISNADFNSGKATLELLLQAKAAEQRGELQNAALLYQRAIEEALKGSGVLTVRDRDKIRRTECFVPVTDFCFEKLLGFGKDIREKYLVSYEHKAQRIFKKALATKNISMMIDLTQRYPLCEKSLEAHVFLADIAAESANYAAAARHYNIALKTRLAYSCKSPEARAKTALLAAKYASIMAILGRSEEIGVITALINTKGLKDEKISLNKNIITLSQALGKSLSASQNAPAPQGSNTITNHAILGGNAARNMLMPGPSGLPGKAIWTTHITNNERTFPIYNSRVRVSQRPHLLSSVPVYWNDAVYINTGKSLLAFNIFDGTRVFKFNQPPRPIKSSSQILPPIETCSVADGIVYAAMPTEGNNMTKIIRHLYAFDAYTQKEIWNSHTQTGLTHGVESVCGDVVVHNGEALFVVSKKSPGDMPISLMCADPKTGRQKWHCDLVSKIGTEALSREPQIADIIAIQDNTAIIATSAGAIVAVDLFSRKIKWGMRYHQTYKPGMHRTNPANPRMWCATQPILHDGKFICAPRDTNTLFCLDAETGRMLWSIPRDNKNLGDILYLVGVRGGLLYYIQDIYRHSPSKTDSPRLCAIDLDTKKEVTNCALRLETSTDKSTPTPLGRPSMNESAIYIPMSDALLMYDIAKNKLHKVFKWEDRNLGPGNLLVTQMGLVVANAAHVALFADSQIMSNLASNNGTPSAANIFRHGKLLYAYGNQDQALVAFEKAAKIATPNDQYRNNLLQPLIVEQIFRCHTYLADKWEKSGKLTKAMSHIRAAIALDVSDEIRARAQAKLANMEVKSADEKIRDHGLDTLQQLITNHPRLIVSPEKNIRQSAAYYSKIRIRELLAIYGRAPYAAYEKHATKLLDAARLSNLHDDYIAVYEKYPNSLAALQALSEIAAQHEKDGNKSMALATLKAACENIGNPQLNIAALVKMERLAVECADFETAHATLARLGKLPTDTKIELGEKKMNLTDFIAKELGSIDMLEYDGTVAIDNKMKIARKIDLTTITESLKTYHNFDIIAPEGFRPQALADKILARKNGIIACYNLTSGKLLWTNGPSRAWLGFEIQSSSKPPRVKKITGDTKQIAIVKGDIIRAINGVEIANNTDFWETIVKFKIGEKVAVEYWEKATGVLKQTVITTSKMPGDFSISPAKMWFNGKGNLVVQVNHPATNATEVRCINIETGATMWFRSFSALRTFINRIKRKTSSGMLVFITQKDMQLEFQALDMISGARTTLPSHIEPNYHLETAPMGANFLLSHRSHNSCQAIDMLTGAFKFELALPNNETTEYRLGGDRLIVAEGEKLNTCVFDTIRGRSLYRADSGQQQYSVSQEAGCEIAILNEQGNAIMFFDSRSSRPPRLISIPDDKFTANHLIVKGKLLCCVDKNRQTVRLYNITTGKLLWEKKLMIRNLNELNFCGEYLVLSHTSYPDKNIAKLKIIILDAHTGTVAFSHEAIQRQRVGSLKARIIGRTLCIIINDKIQVWK